MAVPTKTTRLDAVNRMLSAIGIARVDTIPDANRQDVQEAEAVLDEETINVLQEGWEFNSEAEVELELDGASEIGVPDEVIQIQVPFGRHMKKITTRLKGASEKLYDKTNHTFTFTHNVDADVVYLQDFDFLPQSARWYIMIKAVRKFAHNMLEGAEAIDSFTEEDEAKARAALLEHEGEAGQHNIFNSYDTYQIIARRGGHYGDNWWL